MPSVLLDADAALFRWIDALPHPAWLTVLMMAVTLAGTAATVWLAIGAGVAIRQRDGSALFRLVLAVVSVYLLVDVAIKPAIDRPRPYQQYDTAFERQRAPVDLRVATPSFPSGHAASAAAGAYALSRVLPFAARRLWLLALVIAGSRVYLGVHYPLDVAVGLGLGAGWGRFVTGGMRYAPRFSGPPAGPTAPPAHRPT